jgi:hypothetical protein
VEGAAEVVAGQHGAGAARDAVGATGPLAQTLPGGRAAHLLAERRRGRRPGEQAALSEHQQQELIALVRGSTPDQLGLAGCCGPAMRSAS